MFSRFVSLRSQWSEVNRRGNMPNLNVSEITEARLPEFVELPYILYKGDSCWVGELKKDVISLLSLTHPFWKHGKRKFFMAFSDGKPVGRIAAVVNYNHNSYHNEKCGFFGFFESVNDAEVARVLFAQAENWLRSEGMTIARGPMNPSTNESCGLLIEGFDSPPRVMMSYNPPYHAELIENCGFAKAKDLYAYRRFSADPISERIEKIIARTQSRGSIKVRRINLRDFENELQLAISIYNDAWSKNWGFVPMEEEEIRFLGRMLKPILKPDHVLFLEADGKPAAFSLTIPDVNVALQPAWGRLTLFNAIPTLLRLRKIKQGRLLALGVSNAFRNRGLELVLIKEIVLTSRRQGWVDGELSWILEDNHRIINVIEAVDGHLYKKYRIYEKTL